MASDFDSIKALIESGNIKGKKIRDHTFFDVGLRGHFENPFTEVLSYLLKAESQYENSNKFAELFLNCLPNLTEEIIESFRLEMNIKTQDRTTNGKIIDLIIINSKYVLVFENKINHVANNPFEDYENYIISTFKNLTPYYYILSKDPITDTDKWTNVIINNTFIHIKNGLSKYPNNKWDYFVNEFLTHHTQLNDTIMNQEQLDFYEKNYSTIFEAYNNVRDFVNIVVVKIKNNFPNQVIKSANPIQSDEKTIIVRFFPIECREDHVMLAFAPNNKISINLYYYQDPKQKTVEIIKHLGTEDYIIQNARTICYFRRNINLKFTNIDEAVAECCNQITIMKKCYTDNICSS